MINKNIFLKSVGCSAGKFAKEANDLIYNWHNLYNFDIKLNQIDERLIRTLTIAINFWKHLVSFETEGFRDSIGRLSFHKLLKEIIENDKEINYFGILCPSYKKGIRAIGFSDEPGNTTYRAFDNLKIMAENTNLLGIKCNVRMFYADISFENYKKLSKQDKKDIEKNI